MCSHTKDIVKHIFNLHNSKNPSQGFVINTNINANKINALSEQSPSMSPKKDKNSEQGVNMSFNLVKRSCDNISYIFSSMIFCLTS